MLSVETRLPTPFGWTTVGNLVTGATVFDELGYPVQVTSLGDIQVEKAYRVGLTNNHSERGAVFMTEGQRLCTWNREAMRVFTRDYGVKTVPTDWPFHEGKRWSVPEVKDTFEFFEKGGAKKLMHVIPMTFPLVLPHRDVPVPPYIMGLCMQLHDRYTGLMTCKERMWDWYEAQFVGAGFPLTRTKKRLKRYRPANDVVFSSAQLNRLLGRERDYDNKGLIPLQYLRGSAQQRMELLTGLIDISFDDINTHGDTNSMHNKESSVIVWCGQKERLCEQVLELVRSLGYVAVPAYHRYANSYTVSYTPVDNPYRYPKFRAELPDLTRLKRNTFQRFCWRVQSVEMQAETQVRDFTVNSPSGLVTVSDLFLPVVAGDT